MGYHLLDRAALIAALWGGHATKSVSLCCLEDKREEGRLVKLMDKPKAARPMAPRVAPAKKPAAAPRKRSDTEWPAEGPHAREDLINEDATPGSGLFSSKAKPGGKVDPGAG